jgi:hypothetical protein
MRTRATGLLIGVLGCAALCAPAQVLAAWEYKEIADGFGKTAFVLQVDSSLPVEGTDLKQHYPLMQLRCDKDGGEPYWRVHWFAIVKAAPSSNLSVDLVEGTRMQVRVDGKDDRRDVWNWYREDALEGINTYRAAPVTKTLRDASELQLRIAGLAGKTYDATFDVSGLAAALEQLKPHCRKV